MMDLVRRVNSTYTQVNRNIELLESEGIVETKRLGRIKIIQLLESLCLPQEGAPYKSIRKSK